MKFRDLLINEKFVKGIKLSPEGYKEIYVNPSKSELKEIIKTSTFKDIRLGVEDKPNGKIYAWDGDILHERMLKFLIFDFGLDYKIGNDFVKSTQFTLWEKFKNKKSFKKNIKKLLGVKFLIIWKMNDIPEEIEL